jgi:hypothetical protein
MSSALSLNPPLPYGHLGLIEKNPFFSARPYGREKLTYLSFLYGSSSGFLRAGRILIPEKRERKTSQKPEKEKRPLAHYDLVPAS